MNGEELYKKYRPKSLKEVVGQEDALKSLATMGRAGAIPHTLLLTGPSGCGKTTIARILKTLLGCSDNDFNELNGSETRGIDTVREIQSRIGIAPLGGKCRIWLIDEAHALTGDAQNALLKILEDTPKHVYFILATTDPAKLKKTIITRCTEIRLKEIDRIYLKELVMTVAKSEGVDLTAEVTAKIADVAEGSARKALVLLHAVLGITDPAAQLAAVEANDTKAQAIELARALMAKKDWKSVSAILQKLDDDPESLRRMVLGYCSATLIKSGNSRAAEIIEAFQFNLFDTGKAGLALACWNSCNG